MTDEIKQQIDDIWDDLAIIPEVMPNEEMN
jgi:hypothetical protein